MQKLIAIFILQVTLIGCTSTQITHLNKHTVELGGGLSFELLQPESYGQALSLTQVAEISSKQGNHELLFVLQIDANEMSVIGLLPNGTRVFTIFYDGTQLKSEGYDALIEKVDPKYLIADIQVSLWPLESLKQGWLFHQSCHSTGRCKIVETVDNHDGSRQRAVVYGEQTILTVQYSAATAQPETVVLNHLERGYQITLESAE